jgi:hypothetical protein
VHPKLFSKVSCVMTICREVKPMIKSMTFAINRSVQYAISLVSLRSSYLANDESECEVEGNISMHKHWRHVASTPRNGGTGDGQYKSELLKKSYFHVVDAVRSITNVEVPAIISTVLQPPLQPDHFRTHTMRFTKSLFFLYVEDLVVGVGL